MRIVGLAIVILALWGGAARADSEEELNRVICLGLRDISEMLSHEPYKSSGMETKFQELDVDCAAKTTIMRYRSAEPSSLFYGEPLRFVQSNRLLCLEVFRMAEDLGWTIYVQMEMSDGKIFNFAPDCSGEAGPGEIDHENFCKSFTQKILSLKSEPNKFFDFKDPDADCQKKTFIINAILLRRYTDLDQNSFDESIAKFAQRICGSSFRNAVSHGWSIAWRIETQDGVILRYPLTCEPTG